MPSPTEMTLPTSLTSTPPRYSSICSRIIFVISSALISISFSIPRLFFDQAAFECLQSLANRSIVNRTSNLCDYAADQGRIDGNFHPNLLSRGTFEPGRQFPLFRSIQRMGSRDARAHNAEALVQKLLIRLNDFFQKPQPVPVHQNADKIRDATVQTQCVENFFEQPLAALARRRGVFEKPASIRLFIE